MAKWTLPEGKIYTQSELDAAVAAALREAADVAGHFYAKGQVTKPEDITALISDAGKALDRYVKERSDEALAEQRNGIAEMLEFKAKAYDEAFALAGQDEHATRTALAQTAKELRLQSAAIRHGSAISAQGET